MEREWVFFKNVNFKDINILQYHIDTRDFYVSISFSEFEELEEKCKALSIVKDLSEFLYTEEEVISMLNRYYEDSGGHSDWRFFNLDHSVGNNWSLKYIRIYRVKEGFLVCNSKNDFLSKSVTNSIVLNSVNK